MSPAVNTPGTLVIQRSSRQTLPRSVIFTPSFVEHPVGLGSEESHRQQDEVGLQLELAVRDRLELHAAAVRSPSPRDARAASSPGPCRVAGEPLASRSNTAARRLLRAPTRRGRCSARAATGCPPRARRAAAAAARADARSRAPWRCAVPRQSAPVSPPPMMIDVLVLRADELIVVEPARLRSRRFCSVRYSIAKWMPCELAARHRQIARPRRRRRRARSRRTRRAARRPGRRRRRSRSSGR